jgi:hypothetical protein
MPQQKNCYMSGKAIVAAAMAKVFNVWLASLWLCERLAKAQALRTGAKAYRPIQALPL